jgi:ankyrin repeat protein
MVRQSVAQGVDVNVVGPHGETALLEAIGEGRADIVQALVEAGADVNYVQSAVGHPAPLRSALCARPIRNPGDVDESAAIVGLLLTHGARVHDSASLGITALQQAAGCGNTATLAALLAAGADVSDGDSPGPLFGFGTPLHYAARANRPENVAFLLDHKANINARTAKGATPLCWAVAAADVEAVRLLLNRGADVNLAVDGDVTPVFMAHEMGGMDVQRSTQGKEMEALLKSHGAFLNPITVAKYKLLTAIGATAFLMDSGKSTY